VVLPKQQNPKNKPFLFWARSLWSHRHIHMDSALSRRECWQYCVRFQTVRRVIATTHVTAASCCLLCR